MTDERAIPSSASLCRHADSMDYLVLRGTRASSFTEARAAAELGEQIMTECRAECGGNSPYRNIPPAPAAAIPTSPYSAGFGPITEALALGGRDLAAFVKRLFRRS